MGAHNREGASSIRALVCSQPLFVAVAMRLPTDHTKRRAVERRH